MTANVVLFVYAAEIDWLIIPRGTKSAIMRELVYPFSI